MCFGIYLPALSSAIKLSLQCSRRVGWSGLVFRHAFWDGDLRLVRTEHDAVAHGLGISLHRLVFHCKKMKNSLILMAVLIHTEISIETEIAINL